MDVHIDAAGTPGETGERSNDGKCPRCRKHVHKGRAAARIFPMHSIAPDEARPPLDAGIRRYVDALRSDGIETFESCEGGPGHAYPEPTIRFYGDRTEGFRALSIAHRHQLPVLSIRRTWPIVEGEPTGPWWEMTFSEADQRLTSAGH